VKDAREWKELAEFLFARAMEHDAPKLPFLLACKYLISARVEHLLTDQLPAELDELLVVDPLLGRTRLAGLATGPTSSSPAAIKQEREKLTFLRRMDAHTRLWNARTVTAPREALRVRYSAGRLPSMSGPCSPGGQDVRGQARPWPRAVSGICHRWTRFPYRLCAAPWPRSRGQEGVRGSEARPGRPEQPGHPGAAGIRPGGAGAE
jgi:hypothetical protein